MNMIDFRIRYGRWEGDAEDMRHLADIQSQQRKLKLEIRLTPEQRLQQAIARTTRRYCEQR